MLTSTFTNTSVDDVSSLIISAVMQNGVSCADNCKCNDCLNLEDGMSDKMKLNGSYRPDTAALSVLASAHDSQR